MLILTVLVSQELDQTQTSHVCMAYTLIVYLRPLPAGVVEGRGVIAGEAAPADVGSSITGMDADTHSMLAVLQQRAANS